MHLIISIFLLILLPVKKKSKTEKFGFFFTGLFVCLGFFVRRNRADSDCLSLKITLIHSLGILFFHKLVHIKYIS